MLALTDSAVIQLKKLISKSEDEDPIIRVFHHGCGCCGQPSYGLKIIRNGQDGDVLLEKDGLKVFIESAASDGLDKATIDYKEVGLRSGFMMYGLQQSIHC